MKLYEKFILKEIKAMGLTWDEAEIVAMDRVGYGREWRPHAPRGALSKKKKKKLEFKPLLSCMYFIHKQIKCLHYYIH